MTSFCQQGTVWAHPTSRRRRELQWNGYLFVVVIASSPSQPWLWHCDATLSLYTVSSGISPCWYLIAEGHNIQYCIFWRRPTLRDWEMVNSWDVYNLCYDSRYSRQEQGIGINPHEDRQCPHHADPLHPRHASPLHPRHATLQCLLQARRIVSVGLANRS